MSDIAKMELPPFIQTTAIMYYKDNTEPRKMKVRFNPFSVSSYHETFYNDGEEKKPCVFMYVGAAQYLIDMTIGEADEMMNNIDRGLSMKENNDYNG